MVSSSEVPFLNRAFYLFRFPTSTPDPELAKLLWLIRLRWLALAVFFLLSAPALIMGILDRNTMPMFLGLVGYLFVFNLFTQLILPARKSPLNPLWVCFQLAFDLLILTLLLDLTGGFANPLFALLFLNAALGGLLITTRLSWPFIFLAHTALGFLQFQFVKGDLEQWNSSLLASFGLYHFLLLSFWLVMRSLGAHLERQHERQVQARTRLETQDRLRAIGALSAGFSHEFASPLNSAKIRLERVARTFKSEDVTEALAAIEACENVVRQMNSAQLDRRDYRFKTVVVEDLLRDVVDSWREEHADTAVGVQSDDGSAASLPPVNFAQVIINLLDNAYDVAPGKDIQVLLKGTDDRFVLEVSDRGSGFHASVISRLGEPFVTTKANGTGLGLYVSQLFCQSLGGWLELKNTAEGGLVRLSWPKRGDA